MDKLKEEVAAANEHVRTAKRVFTAMLLACLYVLITIATTADTRLLTNSASSPLPFIGVEIPIVGFYIVVPVILLAIYSYLGLYMQRLWEHLAVIFHQVVHTGRPSDAMSWNKKHGIARSPAWTSIRMHD